MRNCSHKSAFWNLHGGPSCPADPAEVVSWSATWTPPFHTCRGSGWREFRKLPRVIPCYFMLFHAIPYSSKWIHIIPCSPYCSILSHVIPSYSMLLHAIPCDSMLSYVIPCHSELFYNIPRCYKLFNGIPYYSTLFNVIPCYSTVFHVIPCYSTSQLLAHNDSRLINPRRAYQLRTVCVAGLHLIISP